jgi:hypothetical protein
MCVGEWSWMGFVKDRDLKAATVLPEVGGDESLEEGWDSIQFE